MRKSCLFVVLLLSMVVPVRAASTLPQAGPSYCPDGANVSPTGSQDEFVVGMVLVGPHNDKGWSQAHVEGACAISKENPQVRFVFFDNLNPVGAPETTLNDVVSQMIAQGAKLIITTSDSFKDDTVKVAKANPDTTFINISGDDAAYDGAPANLSNFTSQLSISRMIAGCEAALLTKTGNVGLLGPRVIPETLRDQSSAYLGFKYCLDKFRPNEFPKPTFKVTWIGDWFNIPGVTLDPTEEVKSFYDTGFDVVISGIDTTEALDVAATSRKEGKEVYAIATDNRHACEDVTPAVACAGAQYYNWYPAYSRAISMAMAGQWKQTFEWYGPNWDNINDEKTSNVGFVFGSEVPKDVQDKVNAFIADIAKEAKSADNILPLWKGPLSYQDGKPLIEKGYLPAFQKPTEGPSVWYQEDLLQGMIGAGKQDKAS